MRISDWSSDVCSSDLYVQMARFWLQLQQHPGMGARALAFKILTATRTGEVLGARWAEIDMPAQLWTIPAHRMKAGEELRVPLSDAAVSLLRVASLSRQSDLVFPGQSGATPLDRKSVG